MTHVFLVSARTSIPECPKHDEQLEDMCLAAQHVVMATPFPLAGSKYTWTKALLSTGITIYVREPWNTFVMLLGGSNAD